MSKVYFIPITDYDKEELSDIALELFNEVLAREEMELAREITIKVHLEKKGTPRSLTQVAIKE